MYFYAGLVGVKIFGGAYVLNASNKRHQIYENAYKRAYNNVNLSEGLSVNFFT